MRTRKTPRYVSRLTRGTLAVILAGGRGTRLQHLTLARAKPATPFGGKFRIIDFPLSNCVNSGIRQICVMTQYKAHDLILHVQRAWGFLRGEFGEFVELLPAQQQMGEAWYRGTADAVYQNLDIISLHAPEHVVVLAGDHIYKMDYGPMVAYHEEKGADITVGCVEVPREQATGFGVLSVNVFNRVTKFTEKPAEPEGIPGREAQALASMGIYVFNRRFLETVLQEDAADAASAHDFGHNIIPACISGKEVFAYPFTDVKTRAQNYWRDVGTVDAYYDANIELVAVNPELNLYDDEWPIWTYQHQFPPAKFIHDNDERRGMAVNSMVCSGSIISGSRVRRSLLFTRVHVHSHSLVEDAVILPHVDVGRDCRIKRVVIDEHCMIPDGTVIGEEPELDRQRFHVTDKGVVLVTPDMLEND